MFRVYDSKNRHLGKLSDAEDALVVANNHTGSTVKVGPRKGRVVVWKHGEPLDPALVRGRADAVPETGDDHIASAQEDADD